MNSSGAELVLISEVVAEQLFLNQSALGQILDLGDFGEGSWEFEIIGVYKLYPPLLDLFITQPHLIFLRRHPHLDVLRRF